MKDLPLKKKKRKKEKIKKTHPVIWSTAPQPRSWQPNPAWSRVAKANAVSLQQGLGAGGAGSLMLAAGAQRPGRGHWGEGRDGCVSLVSKVK